MEGVLQFASCRCEDAKHALAGGREAHFKPGQLTERENRNQAQAIAARLSGGSL